MLLVHSEDITGNCVTQLLCIPCLMLPVHFQAAKSLLQVKRQVLPFFLFAARPRSQLNTQQPQLT